MQVNWSSHVEPVEDTGDGGWDMHDRNFQQFQDRHSWMLDQALSTLLDDLEERGLLSETVVVALGEFGRTPKINGNAGRDHWPQVSCAMLAGGGMRTGQVIGSTNRLGEHAVERPVHFQEVFATLYKTRGIDVDHFTVDDLQGRPRYLVEQNDYRPMPELV